MLQETFVIFFPYAFFLFLLLETPHKLSVQRLFGFEDKCLSCNCQDKKKLKLVYSGKERTIKTEHPSALLKKALLVELAPSITVRICSSCIRRMENVRHTFYIYERNIIIMSWLGTNAITLELKYYSDVLILIHVC